MALLEPPCGQGGIIVTISLQESLLLLRTSNRRSVFDVADNTREDGLRVQDVSGRVKREMERGVKRG